MSRDIPEGVAVDVLGPSDPGSSVPTVSALIAGLPGSVRQVCRHCGSTAHGGLLIDRDPPMWVSAGRTKVLTLVARSTIGPVGVDVERLRGGVNRVASVIVPDVERPEEWASGDLLARWCRIEAAVKATGDGLTVDPRAVTLLDGSWTGHARLLVPSMRGHQVVQVMSVSVPDHVAALATLDQG